MKTLRIAVALIIALGALPALASPRQGGAQTAAEYWTAERVASANPRDLVIDHRGLGYLRDVDGGLTPYGHSVAATKGPTPAKGKPGGGVVRNAEWSHGGVVQVAAGRILFTMPDGDYVCSGTVVTDGVTGRSIVLTAAHCVFDDVAKEFSSYAMFIPNQAGTTGAGTDWNCTNDPVGCWELDHGVVDVNWTSRTFPDNIPWDYAYYVVSDFGAHTGTGGSALDGAAGSMVQRFSAPTTGGTTHALGYSYSVDPNFMYCAEGMSTYGADNYWLGSCGLSGGSSGGPWVQPMNTATGDGPVISVNSWGFTGQPGMAGPKLAGTSASLVFSAAKNSALNGSGVTVDPSGSTTTTTSATTTTTTTSSTSSTTTTTTTTTTAPPEQGTLAVSTTNNGRTWTAVVRDTSSVQLLGVFSPGGGICEGDTCSVIIRKNVGSVVFTPDDGRDPVTILKP